ncbi:MAG: DNA alkylation repair protein, partial [Candidatus Sericytochromatia bacterium]
MTLDAVMAELEAAGTEQARKIYRRHGVPDPMFGVSFAKLGELKKRLKVNQDLADALWATGNADARVLAAMIGDPKRQSPALLEAWASAVRGHTLAGYVGELAAKTPFA